MMTKKFLILVLLVSAPLFARGGSSMLSALPTNLIFPVPAPILFPGFATAAGVNPAALGLAGKVAAAQASYTPGQGGNASEYFAGLAAGSQKMGIGLGYIGDQVSGGNMVNNAYGGVGFKIDPVAMGVGLRQFNLSGGSDPAVDLGLIAGEGGSGGGSNGLRFGFVAYNLNSHAQLDLGVGFSGGKKYNMEINLLLPPFGGSSGSSYVITVAGTLYAADVLGLSFRTSYFSGQSTYQHTIGLQAWLWEPVAVFTQFSTPHTWTGGLMVTF